MALKLPDSAVPMGDFPVAKAVDIDFDDGENLQEKLDDGKLGGGAVDLSEYAKTYTSLDALGLTADATVQDVINALPIGGTAFLRTDAFTNWSTLFNGIQYGYLKVEKTVNGLSNIELQEIVEPNRRYFGTQAKGAFSKWVRIDNESRISELEANQIKRAYIINMTTEIGYYKITAPTASNFSKILMADFYGGCVLITGSTTVNTDYKSFKVVRLSNGAPHSYSASNTESANRILNIYFDGSFIYVKCNYYSKIYIEGDFNIVENINTLPSNVIELPIIDLTQSVSNPTSGASGLITGTEYPTTETCPVGCWYGMYFE